MGFWICVLVCICVCVCYLCVCMHARDVSFCALSLLSCCYCCFIFYSGLFIFCSCTCFLKRETGCCVGWVEKTGRSGQSWGEGNCDEITQYEKQNRSVSFCLIKFCTYVSTMFLWINLVSIFQHSKSLFQKTDVLALYILYLFILVSLIAFTY